MKLVTKMLWNSRASASVSPETEVHSGIKSDMCRYSAIWPYGRYRAIPARQGRPARRAVADVSCGGGRRPSLPAAPRTIPGRGAAFVVRAGIMRSCLASSPSIAQRARQ
jgi:hypothetical protein